MIYLIIAGGPAKACCSNWRSFPDISLQYLRGISDNTNLQRRWEQISLISSLVSFLGDKCGAAENYTIFSGWVDQLPPASEDLTRPAGGLQDPGWRQNEGHCGQLPTPPASEWKKCQLLELKIVNDDVICTNFNSMLLYISLNIITILSISIEFVNPTPWSRIISGWSPHIIPSLSFKEIFGRCNWPDASNPDITLA